MVSSPKQGHQNGNKKFKIEATTLTSEIKDYHIKRLTTSEEKNED